VFVFDRETEQKSRDLQRELRSSKQSWFMAIDIRWLILVAINLSVGIAVLLMLGNR